MFMGIVECLIQDAQRFGEILVYYFVSAALRSNPHQHAV